MQPNTESPVKPNLLLPIFDATTSSIPRQVCVDSRLALTSFRDKLLAGVALNHGLPDLSSRILTCLTDM